MKTAPGRFAPIPLVAALLAAALSAAPAARPASGSPPEAEWEYVLLPGESIWRITEAHLTDMRYWRPLARRNGLRDPDLVPAGGVVRVPEAWLRQREATARILGVTGSATLAPAGDGEPRAATAGTTVRDGAVLETGPDGSLVLGFADGARLLLEPESRLVVERLRLFGDGSLVDTRLRLERGRARSTVSPEKPGRSRFEIWTRPGISAVRGTGFRTALDPAGERLASEVLEGRVAVSGSGAAVEVPEGFGTRVRAGEPPEPPVPLLPAPRLEPLPGPVDRLPLRIAVEPPDGAVAFRVELAAAPDFEPVLLSRVAESPSVTVGEPPDGEWYVRVRAIDARGLEGLETVAKVTLDARPEPPALQAPRREGRVREPRPSFVWAAPANARAFRFELRREGEAQPLVDREVADAVFVPDTPLPPGRYVWRVATIDAAGEEGPMSDPAVFERVEPLTVEGLAEKEEDGRLVLEWRGGPPGTRYEVQLARDPAFTDLVLDTTVDAPRVSLPRPFPQDYWLRVRAIETDGFVGAFTPPQKITVAPTTLWPAAAAVLLALLAALL